MNIPVFRHTIALVTAGTLALLGVAANASEILLVTDNNTATQSLHDFLTTSEGHSVTRDAKVDGPGDTSAFNLVIVARATNSGNYATDVAEAASWNALTIPIINMSSYLYRSNRWGWISTDDLGGGAAGTGFDDPYPDPAHPILAGLTAPESTVFSASVASRRIPTGNLLPETLIVATSDTSARAGIFTISVGTAMSGSRGTAGALRIAWPMDGLYDWDNINANGEQILRNMISFALTPAGDTDGDGMRDDYEVVNGLDPADDGTLFPDLGPAGDVDMDGLTNLQEHDGLDASGAVHGFGQTRANLADSDGDFIDDNDELTGAANAFQTATPGDAATTAPGLATDPTSADTDGDGLTDEEEVTGDLNIAFAFAPTNPNTGDTDDDGMGDKYEVDNNFLGGLDPNTDDADGNLDGDTGLDGFSELTNIDEYLGASLGVRTRADKLDTDDDGYDDTVEDNQGSWDTENTTGTNPTIADTDGDGILDGDENYDLVTFQGLGVYPANSDPNLADTDGDGLRDNREIDDHGTDPSLEDSDRDGASDPGELFVFGTDASDAGDAPSADQWQELRVNFKANSTAGEALDFQHYTADHENLATFVDRDFAAFDTTVTVSLSWDDGGGAGVAGTAPQMIHRTTNLGAVEWAGLLQDFTGTDARSTPAEPMMVTILGLPAGTYLWTSYHNDIDNQTGTFDATITHAGGSATQTAVDTTSSDEGVTDMADIATYQQVFSSNGTDPVTVTFDNNAANPATDPIQTVFFIMNAFTITNTKLPASGPMITNVSFDSPSGDLLVSFTPGGTGFILTSSDNLIDAFTKETAATLENGNTTFRVPAANLNAGQDFFRIEEAP